MLTGLPRADRWPELRTAALEDVLRLARGVADHVVVDTGFAVEDDEELSYDTAAPRRNAATLTALEVADHLVVVGAADPVGLQRLVRAVQDVAVIPSPRPTVVVTKVRASVAGRRPERAIGDVLRRFAGMDAVRFLPWSPDECDAALLAGRSLVELAPRADLTVGRGRAGCAPAALASRGVVGAGERRPAHARAARAAAPPSAGARRPGRARASIRGRDARAGWPHPPPPPPPPPPRRDKDGVAVGASDGVSASGTSRGSGYGRRS